MSQLLPSLLSSGLFEAEAPYNALLAPGVSYTCRSLRTIADVVGSGVDMWTEYYQKHGIDEVRFSKDVEDGVSIVGLQAGTGEWLYLPSSFLTRIPVVDGVTYTTLTLGVGLGPVPDNFRIAPLVTSLENIVKSTLGITPQIKAITTSLPTVIPQASHEKLQVARAARISSTETDYARAERLERELAEAIRQKKALEKYIEDNHT